MYSTNIKIILAIVVLGVFNLLFFLWAPLTPANWVAYVGMTVGILWLSATFVLPTPGRNEIYEMTLPRIAGQYLGVAVVAGIVLMVLHVGLTIMLTAYSLLFVAFLVWFCMHLAANKRTAVAVAAHNTAVANIKDFGFEVKTMMGYVTDSEMKTALARLHDVIIGSPAKSTYDTTAIDRTIADSMQKLVNAVNANDKQVVISGCDYLKGLFARRNRC